MILFPHVTPIRTKNFSFLAFLNSKPNLFASKITPHTHHSSRRLKEKRGIFLSNNFVDANS